MLYKEDIAELGFLAKTPNRKIYHYADESKNYLMEIVYDYNLNVFNLVEERVIVWEAEVSRLNKQPVLHRGPNAKIIVNDTNLTKEEIKLKIEEYESSSI